MILENETAIHPLAVTAAYRAIQKPNPDILRVTELLNPPIIKTLMVKHWDEIRQDVSDMTWSIHGTSVHNMFERLTMPGVVQSFTMMVNVGDVKLKGTLDLLDFNTKEILDFKDTTVWKYVYKDFDKFFEQVNIYRWMADKYGIKVDKLSILAFLKGWSHKEAMAGGNYPPAGMVTITVPVWPLEKTAEFVRERVRAYQTEQDKVCSPKDRFEITKYAVMMKGRKRAVPGGIFESKQDAEEFLKTHNDRENLYIETRAGEPTRCLYYCPVRQFCPFGKTLTLTQNQK